MIDVSKLDDASNLTFAYKSPVSEYFRTVSDGFSELGNGFEKVLSIVESSPNHSDIVPFPSKSSSKVCALENNEKDKNKIPNTYFIV